MQMPHHGEAHGLQDTRGDAGGSRSHEQLVTDDDGLPEGGGGRNVHLHGENLQRKRITRRNIRCHFETCKIALLVIKNRLHRLHKLSTRVEMRNKLARPS